MTFYDDADHDMFVEIEAALKYFDNNTNYKDTISDKCIGVMDITKGTKKYLTRDEFKENIYWFYYSNPVDLIITSTYYINKIGQVFDKREMYNILWLTCIIVYKVIICYDHNIRFSKIISVCSSIDDYIKYEMMFLNKLGWTFSIPSKKMKEMRKEISNYGKCNIFYTKIIS